MMSENQEQGRGLFFFFCWKEKEDVVRLLVSRPKHYSGDTEVLRCGGVALKPRI
jgi:hypothetical protein